MLQDFYCDEVLSGNTPVEIVFETANVLAYYHTRPFYEVHIVVIPKRHISSLLSLEESDSDILIEIIEVIKIAASQILAEHGAARVITNLGEYQENKHLHWHVVYGKQIRDEGLISMNTQQLINQFADFTHTLHVWKRLSPEMLQEPIAEGKWSIAEIVSHFLFWDELILKERLLYIRDDNMFVSIDTNHYNGKASAYAKSGISMEQIFEQSIEMRSKLVNYLRKLEEEQFYTSFQIGTTQVTLKHYIEDLIVHDKHHQQQIVDFLKTKNVSCLRNLKARKRRRSLSASPSLFCPTGTKFCYCLATSYSPRNLRSKYHRR